MKKIWVFFLFSVLAGCTENAENNTVTTETESDNKQRPAAGRKELSIQESVSGCYLRVIGRDTLAAHLVEAGNRVTGHLTFNNFEKDGSLGSVEGVNDDGILKLSYRFQSEGMSSVREIFFRHTGDRLLMGVGEYAVQGDSSYYTNPANLQYNDGQQALKKVSCDVLPEKYRH